MTFNWLEYLNLAKDIVNVQPISSIPEEKRRTSVSRAFYAAYCLARNFLRDIEGHDKNRLKQQDYVIDQFQSDDPDRNDVYTELDRLRDNRRRADYEDEFSSIDKKVTEALYYSEFIIDRLDVLQNRITNPK